MPDNIKLAQVPQGLMPDKVEHDPISKHVQKPVITRPTPEEKQQVILMQQLLAKFANGIVQNLNEFLSNVSRKFTEQQARALAGAIADTGGVQSFDGKWGDKTIGALKTVNEISKVIGLNKFTNIGKYYLSETPENVIKNSQSNIDIIAELMHSVGLGKLIPEHAGGTRPTRYDVIPEVLNPKNIRLETSVQEGGIEVAPSDLDSISSFYNFVQSQLFADMSLLNEVKKMAEKNISLEKLAEEILYSSIIKMAQTPGDVVKPVQDIVSGKNMTVGLFTAAIRWIQQRAKYRHGILQDWLYSGATKEDGTPYATLEDVKAAKAYLDAINNISVSWEVQKDNFLAEGQDPNDTPMNITSTKLINYKHPEKALEKKKETKTETDAKPNSAELGNQPLFKGNDRDGFKVYDMVTGKYFPAEGLINNTINLNNLREYMSESKYSDWLMSPGNLLNYEFNIGSLSTEGGSPRNLVNLYRADERQHPVKFAKNLMIALSKVLNQVYSDWNMAVHNYLRNGYPSENNAAALRNVLNKQRNINHSWQMVLNRRYQDAQDWKIPMYEDEKEIKKDFV